MTMTYFESVGIFKNTFLHQALLRIIEVSQLRTNTDDKNHTVEQLSSLVGLIVLVYPKVIEITDSSLSTQEFTSPDKMFHIKFKLTFLIN